MANSVDQDQTAPIGAVCSWSTLFASILNSSVMFGSYLQQTSSAPIGVVCSWSTLFASILNSSVMFGSYLQQTSSADNICQMHFLLCALRVNPYPAKQLLSCKIMSTFYVCCRYSKCTSDSLLIMEAETWEPDQTAGDFLPFSRGWGGGGGGGAIFCPIPNRK